MLLSGEDAAAVALRPAMHALGLPLLFVAGQRSRTMATRFGLSRDAAFHSVALLLAGTYLLLVAALGYWLRYTGGEWGLALQLLLAVGAGLSLVVILMSGSMRARLRVWLSKHFLRYRYDYRQEWLRFTAAMTDRAGEGDPRALRAARPGPPGGESGRRAVAARCWRSWRKWRTGITTVTLGEWPEIPTSPAPWAEKAWIVDLNAERRNASGVVPVPKSLLEDREAWLLVPLVAAGSLQGWVVLTQPRTAFPLNWEVLDLLRTAASQASGYLSMHQAAEQLLEARKFDAFNRMSAFVVHDLKNIITQLSLMMKQCRTPPRQPRVPDQDMLAHRRELARQDAADA